MLRDPLYGNNEWAQTIDEQGLLFTSIYNTCGLTADPREKFGRVKRDIISMLP
jgi:hypothetical protein